MYKVVNYSAPAWCAPCVRFKPQWHRIEEEFTDREIDFEYVDVDETDLDLRDLNIRSVPTIVLYRDGEEVARQQGAISAAGLDKFIDQYI